MPPIDWRLVIRVSFSLSIVRPQKVFPLILNRHDTHTHAWCIVGRRPYIYIARPLICVYSILSARVSARAQHGRQRTDSRPIRFRVDIFSEILRTRWRGPRYLYTVKSLPTDWFPCMERPSYMYILDNARGTTQSPCICQSIYFPHHLPIFFCLLSNFSRWLMPIGIHHILCAVDLLLPWLYVLFSSSWL